MRKFFAYAAGIVAAAMLVYIIVNYGTVTTRRDNEALYRFHVEYRAIHP